MEAYIPLQSNASCLLLVCYLSLDLRLAICIGEVPEDKKLTKFCTHHLLDTSRIDIA